MSSDSNASQALANFKPKFEFLVGIDSDGCAFDSMEIKHKECFCPNIIKFWGLQPVSKYAREAVEFIEELATKVAWNEFQVVGFSRTFQQNLAFSHWPGDRPPQGPSALVKTGSAGGRLLGTNGGQALSRRNAVHIGRHQERPRSVQTVIECRQTALTTIASFHGHMW